MFRRRGRDLRRQSNPGPVDAQVVAITNEALSLTDQAPQTILSNYFFSVVSSIVLAITAAIVTERIV